MKRRAPATRETRALLAVYRQWLAAAGLPAYALELPLPRLLRVETARMEWHALLADGIALDLFVGMALHRAPDTPPDLLAMAVLDAMAERRSQLADPRSHSHLWDDAVMIEASAWAVRYLAGTLPTPVYDRRRLREFMRNPSPAVRELARRAAGTEARP